MLRLPSSSLALLACGWALGRAAPSSAAASEAGLATEGSCALQTWSRGPRQGPGGLREGLHGACACPFECNNTLTESLGSQNISGAIGGCLKLINVRTRSAIRIPGHGISLIIAGALTKIESLSLGAGSGSLCIVDGARVRDVEVASSGSVTICRGPLPLSLKPESTLTITDSGPVKLHAARNTFKEVTITRGSGEVDVVESLSHLSEFNISGRSSAPVSIRGSKKKLRAKQLKLEHLENATVTLENLRILRKLTVKSALQVVARKVYVGVLEVIDTRKTLLVEVAAGLVNLTRGGSLDIVSGHISKLKAEDLVDYANVTDTALGWTMFKNVPWVNLDGNTGLVLQIHGGSLAILTGNSFNVSVKIDGVPDVSLRENVAGFVSIKRALLVSLRHNRVLALSLEGNADVAMDGNSGKELRCRQNVFICGDVENFGAVFAQCVALPDCR